jgi:GNAT superfamily N-acetyltransferase
MINAVNSSVNCKKTFGNTKRDFFYDMLSWDTSFFGFKVASIGSGISCIYDLNQVLNSLKNQHSDIKLVYWFSKGLQVQEKELCVKKSVFLGQRVDYIICCDQTTQFNESKVVIDRWHGGLKDKLTLCNLVFQAGVLSRFTLDSLFPENTAKKMYYEWVKKALKRQGLDYEIFVAKLDGDIVGCVILKIQEDTARMEIVVVDEQYRNKKIGSLLISKVKAFCCLRNIKNIFVLTQENNLRARGLYLKEGGIIENINSVYHFWF